VVPVATADDDQAGSHPILVGRKVTLRPGRPGDARKLRAILAEPSVSRWWAEPDPVEVIEEELRGDDSAVLLVVEIDGKVAGGIQYHEENDPMYRQAGIDIYLGGRFQGRGAGTEAVLHQGGLPPCRGHAAVRARTRRHLPRRPADGPAPRRAETEKGPVSPRTRA
jgi:hypothetical protein